MKLSLSLILIVMITVSCEGPIGPAGPEGEQGIAGEQGLTGDQGLTGERGVSRIMFDKRIELVDYFFSELFIDANNQPVQMAGITHDSIKVTSDISVFINRGTVQIWNPAFYQAELTDGRLGLVDANANIYLGETLRIIVTN